MSSDPPEFEEWLHRLSESLASLSAPERHNILQETRSHLRELLAAGCTPSAALGRFGSAEGYAQRFVDEMRREGAPQQQETRAPLHAGTSHVNSTFVASVAVIGFAVLGVLALMAVVTLIFKLSDPVHTGVWRLRPSGWIVGKIRNTAEGSDLLGIWLYPLCVGVLALSCLSGRMLARRIVRNRDGS